MERIVREPGWTLVRRRWPGDPGAPGGRANRVGFDYDAYVPGEISAWDPDLPSSLAADAARVETAVRDLARHAPLLGALAWPLLRTEAIASSRIEGLGVSHHRLALADDPGRDDPLARAVRANLEALRRALDLSDGPITIDALLTIHRSLLGAGAADAVVGAIRDRQNWIGSRHGSPRGAAFVPPPETELRRLLADLCRFCERDDLPATIQAAIAHVQFETIHPFADGNGRVGRALIQVILHRRGLTGGGTSQAVFPPVSLVLAADTDAYIDGLTAFRAGDHRGWLEFFVSAVQRAAEVAEQLASEVTALQADWRARSGAPRRDSAAATLIARLPERPIIGLGDAVDLTGASREATRRAIDRLVASGVLRETSGRRRRRRWESVGLFALLDALDAERTPPSARRRAVRTS